MENLILKMSVHSVTIFCLLFVEGEDAAAPLFQSLQLGQQHTALHPLRKYLIFQLIIKDVLFLALVWQRVGQRLSRLWHTASLYCHHVTSG